MKKTLVCALLISVLLLSVDASAETEVYSQGWDFGGGTLYDNYIYADGRLYNETLGWGWNRSVRMLNRGISDSYHSLNQDFCYSSSPADFTVRVPYSGDYNVTMWSGDSGWCLDVDVYVEGVHRFDLSGDGSSGLWLHDSTIVTVNDGYLNIGVRDKGTIGDSNWRVNGLLLEFVSLATVRTTVRSTELRTMMVTTTVTEVDSYSTAFTLTEETTMVSTELSTKTFSPTLIVVDENVFIDEVETVTVNVTELESSLASDTIIIIIAALIGAVIVIVYYKWRQ